MSRMDIQPDRPRPAALDLRGRVALISGAGSATGIGFAAARALGELGARVAITSTTERINERVASLGARASTPSDSPHGWTSRPR